MNDELRSVWDEICRRNARKSLDECPPTFVPAEMVVEGVFAVVADLGERELQRPVAFDNSSLRIAELFWKSACSTCTVGAAKVLTVESRETVRELARYALVSMQLMAHSRQEYGPVPSGLSGRALGYAALALEILEQRSPQRLIGRQRQLWQ